MFHCPFEKNIYFLSSNFHNFLLLHHDRTFNCEFIIIRGTLLIQLSGEYFPFESPLSVICLHKRKKENFSWKKKFSLVRDSSKSSLWSKVVYSVDYTERNKTRLGLQPLGHTTPRQKYLTNFTRHMQIQKEAKNKFLECLLIVKAVNKTVECVFGVFHKIIVT